MIVRGWSRCTRAGARRAGRTWAPVWRGSAAVSPGWLRVVLEAQALGFQNKDSGPTGELSAAQSAAPTAAALIAAVGVLNRREFREMSSFPASG